MTQAANGVNITDLISNATSVLWYFLMCFWTLSGIASSVSAALPPPISPDEKDATKKSSFFASKFYRVLYRGVNIAAQNLAWAKNLNDPRVRTMLNLMVKTLAGAFVANSASAMLNSTKSDDDTSSSDDTTDNKS